MCFFGGAGKRGTAQSLAKLALAYAMVALRINVLLGEQVYSNYAARNFALRLGFKEVARIPNRHVIDGRFEDGRVVMLKDDDFLPKFFEWKEKQPKIEG
jgi:RimJ/RimL family protein N-acetyltransferase